MAVPLLGPYWLIEQEEATVVAALPASWPLDGSKSV